MPEEIKDTYKSIKKPSEGFFKDKGSKFIARAFHVNSEEEIKDILSRIKKEYHDARHHCYAYRLGVNEEKYRYNDDGEPSSTAGRPIFGQILSSELTDILIIVIRYFGGTKLGVSGLINAYKTAAKDAIDKGTIIEKTINDILTIQCSYQLLNQCMRIIKENSLYVTTQDFKESCKIVIEIKKNDSERIQEILEKIHGVQIELVHICK